ncbi:MAG: hypothetical protein GF388_03230, partial [Candidatus Aegiribacteria sp.]|nr:hypothetical protein [Candidatus Aegiribacteria sp.]MBD3294281.1 hypothetical protein [Candidatus Fermentibacteria bacterium]
MKSLKTALIVLVSVLAAALAVSLIRVESISRKLNRLQLQYSSIDEEFHHIMAQRDSLA